MSTLVLRRLLVAVLALLLVPSVHSQGTPAPAPVDRMVDIGGARLHVSIGGSGTPTVVFESGIGDSSRVWAGIAPKVAEFARVITYDRAGLGRSDPGNTPRNFAQFTEELHRMLHASGDGGPYILVGHSLGGAIVRTYAAEYPAEVAGLVLVDPLNEAIFKTDAQSVAKDRAAQQAAMQNMPAGPKAEFAGMLADADRGFPDLLPPRVAPETPVALLVARQARPPHWEQAVLDTYLPMVLSSPDGTLVITPNSGHYIQRDQPEVVLDAIRRTVFPNPVTVLKRAVQEDGLDRAIRRARGMKQRYPSDLFPEPALNAAGYAQLYRDGPGREYNNVKNAIELFKLNVEFYPASANAYDSLADAYAAAGNRESALLNYRKSLELDPKNTNAARRIQELTDKPK